MNTLINFELAKMLKEKGFDEPCYKGWDLSEEDSNPTFHEYTTQNKNSDCIETFYTAPTIAEVVMWLYKKHGIWIEVTTDVYSKFCWLVKEFRASQNNYNSPTEAYEAAIEYTLNNLI